MKVVRSLDAVASESKGDNPDPAALRNALARQWEIEAIDSLGLQGRRNHQGGRAASLMHVAYDDSVPYIANVSLSVHFDKTTKVQ